MNYNARMIGKKPKWECIICSALQPFQKGETQREASLCRECGSTWRNRATVLALTQAIGTQASPLPTWEENWSVSGVGFDDAPVIFSRLPTKYVHVNTHLNRFPRLDLLDIAAELDKSFTYVICSDVLEHVPGSVDKAIEGLNRLLKDGGAAVVSVPLTAEESARGEYYPDIVEFQINADHTVQWRDSHGRWDTDGNPEYHGGSGLVLAFRDFTYDGFVSSLKRGGFRQVSEIQFMPEYGVPPLTHSGLFIAWK